MAITADPVLQGDIVDDPLFTVSPAKASEVIDSIATTTSSSGWDLPAIPDSVVTDLAKEPNLNGASVTYLLEGLQRSIKAARNNSYEEPDLSLGSQVSGFIQEAAFDNTNPYELAGPAGNVALKRRLVDVGYKEEPPEGFNSRWGSAENRQYLEFVKDNRDEFFRGGKSGAIPLATIFNFADRNLSPTALWSAAASLDLLPEAKTLKYLMRNLNPIDVDNFRAIGVDIRQIGDAAVETLKSFGNPNPLGAFVGVAKGFSSIVGNIFQATARTNPVTRSFVSEPGESAKALLDLALVGLTYAGVASGFGNAQWGIRGAMAASKLAKATKVTGSGAAAKAVGTLFAKKGITAPMGKALAKGKFGKGWQPLQDPLTKAASVAGEKSKHLARKLAHKVNRGKLTSYPLNVGSDIIDADIRGLAKFYDVTRPRIISNWLSKRKSEVAKQLGAKMAQWSQLTPVATTRLLNAEAMRLGAISRVQEYSRDIVGLQDDELLAPGASITRWIETERLDSKLGIAADIAIDVLFTPVDILNFSAGQKLTQKVSKRLAYKPLKSRYDIPENIDELEMGEFMDTIYRMEYQIATESRAYADDVIRNLVNAAPKQVREALKEKGITDVEGFEDYARQMAKRTSDVVDDADYDSGGFFTWIRRQAATYALSEVLNLGERVVPSVFQGKAFAGDAASNVTASLRHRFQIMEPVLDSANGYDFAAARSQVVNILEKQILGQVTLNNVVGLNSQIARNLLDRLKELRKQGVTGITEDMITASGDVKFAELPVDVQKVLLDEIKELTEIEFKTLGSFDPDFIADASSIEAFNLQQKRFSLLHNAELMQKDINVRISKMPQAADKVKAQKAIDIKSKELQAIIEEVNAEAAQDLLNVENLVRSIERKYPQLVQHYFNTIMTSTDLESASTYFGMWSKIKSTVGRFDTAGMKHRITPEITTHKITRNRIGHGFGSQAKREKQVASYSMRPFSSIYGSAHEMIMANAAAEGKLASVFEELHTAVPGVGPRTAASRPKSGDKIQDAFRRPLSAISQRMNAAWVKDYETRFARSFDARDVVRHILDEIQSVMGDTSLIANKKAVSIALTDGLDPNEGVFSVVEAGSPAYWKEVKRRVNEVLDAYADPELRWGDADFNFKTTGLAGAEEGIDTVFGNFSMHEMALHKKQVAQQELHRLVGSLKEPNKVIKARRAGYRQRIGELEKLLPEDSPVKPQRSVAEKQAGALAAKPLPDEVMTFIQDLANKQDRFTEDQIHAIIRGHILNAVASPSRSDIAVTTAGNLKLTEDNFADFEIMIKNMTAQGVTDEILKKQFRGYPDEFDDPLLPSLLNDADHLKKTDQVTTLKKTIALRQKRMSEVQQGSEEWKRHRNELDVAVNALEAVEESVVATEAKLRKSMQAAEPRNAQEIVDEKLAEARVNPDVPEYEDIGEGEMFFNVEYVSDVDDPVISAKVKDYEAAEKKFYELDEAGATYGDAEYEAAGAAMDDLRDEIEQIWIKLKQAHVDGDTGVSSSTAIAKADTKESLGIAIKDEKPAPKRVKVTESEIDAVYTATDTPEQAAARAEIIKLKKRLRHSKNRIKKPSLEDQPYVEHLQRQLDEYDVKLSQSDRPMEGLVKVKDNIENDSFYREAVAAAAIKEAELHNAGINIEDTHAIYDKVMIPIHQDTLTQQGLQRIIEDNRVINSLKGLLRHIGAESEIRKYINTLRKVEVTEVVDGDNIVFKNVDHGEDIVFEGAAKTPPTEPSVIEEIAGYRQQVKQALKERRKSQNQLKLSKFLTDLTVRDSRQFAAWNQDVDYFSVQGRGTVNFAKKRGFAADVAFKDWTPSQQEEFFEDRILGSLTKDGITSETIREQILYAWRSEIYDGAPSLAAPSNYQQAMTEFLDKKVGGLKKQISNSEGYAGNIETTELDEVVKLLEERLDYLPIEVQSRLKHEQGMLSQMDSAGNNQYKVAVASQLDDGRNAWNSSNPYNKAQRNAAAHSSLGDKGKGIVAEPLSLWEKIVDSTEDIGYKTFKFFSRTRGDYVSLAQAGVQRFALKYSLKLAAEVSPTPKSQRVVQSLIEYGTNSESFEDSVVSYILNELAKDKGIYQLDEAAKHYVAEVYSSAAFKEQRELMWQQQRVGRQLPVDAIPQDIDVDSVLNGMYDRLSKKMLRWGESAINSDNISESIKRGSPLYEAELQQGLSNLTIRGLQNNYKAATRISNLSDISTLGKQEQARAALTKLFRLRQKYDTEEIFTIEGVHKEVSVTELESRGTIIDVDPNAKQRYYQDHNVTHNPKFWQRDLEGHSAELTGVMTDLMFDAVRQGRAWGGFRERGLETLWDRVRLIKMDEFLRTIGPRRTLTATYQGQGKAPLDTQRYIATTKLLRGRALGTAAPVGLAGAAFFGQQLYSENGYFDFSEWNHWASLLSSAAVGVGAASVAKRAHRSFLTKANPQYAAEAGIAAAPHMDPTKTSAYAKAMEHKVLWQDRAGWLVRAHERFADNLDKKWTYLPDRLFAYRDLARFTLSLVFDASRVTEGKVLSHLVANAEFTPDQVAAMGRLTPYEQTRRRVREIADSLRKKPKYADMSEAELLEVSRYQAQEGVSSVRNEFEAEARKTGQASLSSIEAEARRVEQSGILGFSPQSWIFAAFEGMRSIGVEPSRAFKIARSMHTYGIDPRSPAEMSLNFIFFPFSYTKKIGKHVADFIQEDWARAVMIQDGVKMYQMLDENYDLDEVLEDHMPILKEFRQLNPFGFGAGLGQFGGINRDVAKLMHEMFINDEVAANVLNALSMPQGLNPQQLSDPTMGDRMKKLVRAVTDIERLYEILKVQGKEVVFDGLTGGGFRTDQAEIDLGWDKVSKIQATTDSLIKASGDARGRAALNDRKWRHLLDRERSLVDVVEAELPVFANSRRESIASIQEREEELARYEQLYQHIVGSVLDKGGHGLSKGDELIAYLVKDYVDMISTYGSIEYAPIDAIIAFQRKATSFMRRSQKVILGYDKFFRREFGPLAYRTI